MNNADFCPGACALLKHAKADAKLHPFPRSVAGAKAKRDAVVELNVNRLCEPHSEPSTRSNRRPINQRASAGRARRVGLYRSAPTRIGEKVASHGASSVAQCLDGEGRV
jgi:hypothetical protein